MKQYEYMVLYNFPNGNGRIQITRKRPIESYADVEELDEFIQKNNAMEKAYVYDFKLLRVYEVD